MSYLQNGILTLEDFTRPSAARLKQGRVAVIECVQPIPCNPCVDICPRQAITIEGNITNPPTIDFELCNGCGLCVANCPGLAIFTIDESRSETEAEVGIPYEFLPLPEPNEIVQAIDRAGIPVCDARVKQVRNPRGYDRTPVITLVVPQPFSMHVRFFKRKN